MNRRGVTYQVGDVVLVNWRPDFDPRIVHRELQIIRDDLHCNAVRISGRDLERVELAARDALEQGLEVWLSTMRVHALGAEGRIPGRGRVLRVAGHRVGRTSGRLGAWAARRPGEAAGSAISSFLRLPTFAVYRPAA